MAALFSSDAISQNEFSWFAPWNHQATREMQQRMKSPKRQQQRDLPRALHGVPITELLLPILPARDQNLLAKRKSKTGSQSYHEKAPHPPQSIDQA
jgi:hypothetical protein